MNSSVKIKITPDCRDLIESVIFTMSIKSAFPGEMPRVNVDTYLRTARDNIHMFKDCVGDNRAELVLMELGKLQSPESHNHWITAQFLMAEIDKRTLLDVPPANGLQGVTAYPNWIQYAQSVRSLYVAESEMSIGQPSITPTKPREAVPVPAPTVTAHQPSAVSRRLDQEAADIQREQERVRALSRAPDTDLLTRIDALMAQAAIDAQTAAAAQADAMEVDGMDPAVLAAIKEELRQLRFRPLTQAERNRVAGVVMGPNNDEVLIDKFCTPMSRTKMVCLRPHSWLNDEVGRID
jgi:hypothetical protein